MNLQLYTPTQILLNTPIDKIDVEAIDGFYTLLPRHIDFVTALKSSIVTYTINGQQFYAACQRGVLVKQGDLVRISTSFAILEKSLEALKKIIATSFKEMEEERKELNLSISRLELGLTKGLIALSQGTTHANL